MGVAFLDKAAGRQQQYCFGPELEQRVGGANFHSVLSVVPDRCELHTAGIGQTHSKMQRSVACHGVRRGTTEGESPSQLVYRANTAGICATDDKPDFAQGKCSVIPTYQGDGRSAAERCR